MESFAELTERCPSESFEKGQTLLLKDDIPKSVYVIKSGTVRAYIITHDGAERLVALHGPGDDLPVGFGFGLVKSSRYFYEAYSDCRISYVPRKEFEACLRADPEAMYEWHIRAETLIMATFSRINALEQPRAGDKVAFMMFYMATQVGVRLRPHKTRLKLTVTQQEIADSLGLSRETASNEIRKLELKKVISHTRKNYVLYMERLRDYLDKRS